MEKRNQIDYILTPQRFKSSVNRPKTTTFPGADVGSDHDLVTMTINLRLQENRENKNHRIRFYIEKLQETIGGRFATLNFLEPDITNLVNSIGTAMRDTAKEVLGKPKIKQQPWVPDDVLKLCDQRRELKKKRIINEEAHKDIRKTMRKAKNDCINERKLSPKKVKPIVKHRRQKQHLLAEKRQYLGDGPSTTKTVPGRWTEYYEDSTWEMD